MLYSIYVLEKAIFVVLGFPLSHTVLLYVKPVAVQLGISNLNTRPEAWRLLLTLFSSLLQLRATHDSRECLAHIGLHGRHGPASNLRRG